MDSRTRLTEDQVRASFESFRRGLQMLSIPELMELSGRQATEIARIQSAALSQWLSSTPPDLDVPVHHSTPTATPSSARPADRGQRPSPPESRPPSSLELLAGSSRVGPRLAAKLVARDARARARRGR
jgi:hypothetical protein